MAQIKKISTELQLLDKFLDTSGSEGSSGSVLTSTSTGTSWVSPGTPGTGVYLPLAGGTMTGNVIFPGEEANSFKIAFTGASASSGISTVDQSGAGLYIGANSRVNNSGNVVYHDSALPSSGIYFDGWLGDDMEFYTGSSGNPTKRLTIEAGGDAIFTGNVGIGVTGPVQKLHIVDTNGANIILNSNTGAENNGIWMTEGGVATPYANGAYVHYDSTNNAFKINTGTTSLTTKLTILRDSGNVGIGVTGPKAKLDVNGHFCVDSKTHSITNAFTTCLTVNLNNHTGCHVVITAFGDWGSHSSAAYRGEFFLQNGANGYAEPGIILRQDDNTSNGTDQIVCQILDPTGSGNPKDFEIQIRTTATTGTTSFTGQLTYTVQGKFNSIT